MNNWKVREQRLLQEVDGDVIDPLTFVRRNIYQLSKSAWAAGPARRLPIIELSANRKGIKRSAWRADLEGQTTAPRAAA